MSETDTIEQKHPNRKLYCVWMALSNAQGMLVVARMSTSEFSSRTAKTKLAIYLYYWLSQQDSAPFIWFRNSIFARRDVLHSLSLRWPHKASIPSKNTMQGCFSRANSNKYLILFSPSPAHCENRSDGLIEMNVFLNSVTVALAKYDLPVPGAYSKINLDRMNQ